MRSPVRASILPDREPAVTTATKRTQQLHGVSIETRNCRIAGTEAVVIVPLCEALPPCRGQRTHHVQKDCAGNWEIPRLTIGKLLPWSASGKRGAVADDVRRREVGPRNSSCEAGEQRGAIRRGVSGAKDGDQGKCGSAKHAPGSVPGKCVTGAGTHVRGARGNSRPYRDRAEILTAHSSKRVGAFVKAIFVIALSVRPMMWLAA